MGLPWMSNGLDFAYQCRGAGSIPGWGPKIPHAPQLKNQSIFENPRNNIVANLVKIFNTVHVRKKKLGD